jgi:hypothetical protein
LSLGESLSIPAVGSTAKIGIRSSEIMPVAGNEDRTAIGGVAGEYYEGRRLEVMARELFGERSSVDNFH